ncbi:MAG TPA: hypothetical protein VHJ78_00715 [Actinomycetota bacterium]|nr:hypothetical protein [Actinomycetota bacterium]
MADPDPQYPDDRERSDGTVEPDESDNSSAFGIPSVSTKVADGEPGGPEIVSRG